MKKSKITIIRLTIQVLMLMIVGVAATNHYLGEVGKGIPWVSESVFHYICPVCGIISIYEFFSIPTLVIEYLKSTGGVMISFAIISSVIFGPIICGFICPFGAIQDLLSRVGKKIFKRKYNTFVSNEVHNKLKYLRYAVLIATILLTMSSAIALLEAINPYHAFLSIFNREFTKLGIIGFVMLLLVIGLSLFIQRPWCKYICPYGAFLGVFNKIKVFRVFRNEDTCVSCKKCTNKCPMFIDVHKKGQVRSLGCISCMECVGDNVCPRENTIAFSSVNEGEVKVVESSNKLK